MNPPNEDLSGLPREAVPPGGLEDATVEALRARGLLRRAPARGRARRVEIGMVLAASILLFLGGVAVGRQGRAAPPAPAPRFVLLLYEGPEYRQPAPGEDAARVREYRAWASPAASPLRAGDRPP